MNKNKLIIYYILTCFFILMLNYLPFVSLFMTLIFEIKVLMIAVLTVALIAYLVVNKDELK